MRSCWKKVLFAQNNSLFVLGKVEIQNQEKDSSKFMPKNMDFLNCNIGCIGTLIMTSHSLPDLTPTQMHTHCTYGIHTCVECMKSLVYRSICELRDWALLGLKDELPNPKWESHPSQSTLYDTLSPGRAACSTACCRSQLPLYKSASLVVLSVSLEVVKRSPSLMTSVIQAMLLISINNTSVLHVYNSHDSNFVALL